MFDVLHMIICMYTAVCIEFLRKIYIANPRSFSFWQIHSDAIHKQTTLGTFNLNVLVCIYDDMRSGSSLTFHNLNTSECRI